MQKFKLSLVFYTQFLWVSLFANFFFYFIGIPIIVSLSAKIAFLGFFIFWRKIKDEKSPYVFYQNLGLSLRYLFLSVVVFDAVLLKICYAVFNFLL
ncbi:hypothetical protein GGR31_001227 [Mesonia maritima]|uniref:ATP synthase F0 subunit 8 n=1 Tax=Mesonia maritima TaxID=1793873 RepID=A0ABU1K4T0_9FLAO|nr:hypothetical protein [Mesonia maritima]